jgi:hypothetical protein
MRTSGCEVALRSPTNHTNHSNLKAEGANELLELKRIGSPELWTAAGSVSATPLGGQRGGDARRQKRSGAFHCDRRHSHHSPFVSIRAIRWHPPFPFSVFRTTTLLLLVFVRRFRSTEDTEEHGRALHPLPFLCSSVSSVDQSPALPTSVAAGRFMSSADQRSTGRLPQIRLIRVIRRQTQPSGFLPFSVSFVYSWTSEAPSGGAGRMVECRARLA